MNLMKITMVFLLFFMATVGYSQEWKHNLEEAKKEALEQNKKILLVFSGSDWCGPCIKLEKNVWQSDAFRAESKKNWVLIKADFPKKKANLLSPELTKNNEKLAEKYNKEGNFPLVVLLDKTGKVIGEKGYVNISAEDYIQALHSLEN
jgi:thioredoxin-related protein